MKKSKIISIALTLVFVISMAMIVPVSAAGSGSITITAPERISISGKTFEAYKLFDVKYNNDGTSFAYTPIDDYSDFKAYPTHPAQSLQAYVGSLESNSAELNALSDALWRYIKGKGIAAENSATVNNSNIVTIGNLSLGYYLVFDTDAAQNDNEELVAACALTTTQPTANVNLKADAPSITKDVKKHDGSLGSETHVNIGDTVEFKLVSAVPDMIGYDSYTFTVHDTMTGIAYVDDSVVVTVNAEPFTALTTNTTNNGNTVNFVFNPVTFASLNKGDEIVITYSAVLTSDAKSDSNENINSVILEYSNNPYFDSTGETPSVHVNVYTYSFEVFKFTVKDEVDVGLADAKFELRRTADETSPAIVFRNMGSGQYRVATDDEVTDSSITTTTELVSPDEPNKGKLKLEGLDAATYYLFETAAPEGYNRLTIPTVFEIIPSSNGNRTIEMDNELTTFVGVENNAGALFPSTGGIGRTIFIASGLLLMCGAVVMLIIRRKVSNI